jgi:choline kinase
MKVLIMAAGVGSRISRYLQGQPKCCVDVDGKPLIRHTIELLNKKGITDIAIVTGYQERYIHQALEGLAYSRYFNPFFRVANSISSVWFARDFLTTEDDMMIMNGDVFMEEKIIDILLKDKRSPMMLSDSTRIEDADYRFNWDGELLKRYGKQLTKEETTGEYVGIGRINKEDVTVFKQNTIDAISNEDYNCWWEDIIYRTVDDGQNVYVNDVAGVFWAEVDYIEDYDRIKAFVNSKS